MTLDRKLMVATIKQGSMLEMFDPTSGESLAQGSTSNNIAQGVTISRETKYAFVSSEGKGAMAGKVDVYDLAACTKIATADVGPQASGAAFWKSVPANP